MTSNGLPRASMHCPADPNIGKEATYVAQVDAPRLVRVISRRPDAITDFGDARLWSEAPRFDLRVSEVDGPRPGDWIEIGDEAFVVQGEPVRGRERLIWTVDVRPADREPEAQIT